MMTWAGNAVIGFKAGGTIYGKHDNSGTNHANEVACIDHPLSFWSYVIYPLTTTGITMLIPI